MNFNMMKNEYCETVDISEIGVVTRLDAILRSQSNFHDLSIASIFACCSTRKDVASLLVGLWAFDFLKNPRFLDGKLLAYNENYLSAADVEIIAFGLLSIIQCCQIEVEEDVDAIDYHYAACGKLYRLLGNNAEDFLLEQLERSPSIALIDAMGILAGHQIQGSLSEKTLKQLKKIADENILNFGGYARKVLDEDVD